MQQRRYGQDRTNASQHVGAEDRDEPPGAAKETKPDWVGLAIAGIGLLAALVGWLKG
jgi:hypothetical protein